MRIGIIGAGKMAETMCRTMSGIKGAELYAVASRDADKAKAFGNKFGFAKTYGDYSSLIADEKADLVYIATPHSHHFGEMIECVNAGRNVLCEKAFTVNAREAEEVRRLAGEKGVFVAEAIWTRYMPSRAEINDRVARGFIGEPVRIKASLSYPVADVPRIKRRDLGGGALLDLGVYGLNFAMMHFGADFCDVEAKAEKMPSGTDGSTDIVLRYPGGKVAELHHDVYKTEIGGIIYGTEGEMRIDNVNRPSVLEVFDASGKLREKKIFPMKSGYEFEVEECLISIENGLKEAPSMPLADSVAVMRLIDKVKEKCGLTFPADEVL